MITGSIFLILLALIALVIAAGFSGRHWRGQPARRKRYEGWPCPECGKYTISIGDGCDSCGWK